MSNSTRRSKLSVLACSSVIAIAFAQLLSAAKASAADTDQTVAENTTGGGTANSFGTGIETVVVTGAKFNPNNAPAKASLDTTEPQTIINQNYIQDSIPQTADYVTILAIVPSLTGLSINGPGLSDGSVKNTLRGQPDGNFAMTFDGVPFGDTNGPTHHSESYFPASTIGGIDVDRGPGNAGNLGAATFGGTISMYSEGLTPEFRARQTFTYGSWNTFNINTNLQSGNLDLIDNGPTRALVNFQYTGSEGYLTGQNTIHDNELIKIEQDLGPNWTLTFLANRNELIQHLSDVNGATPGQVLTFGKHYALERNIPLMPDWVFFNGQHKQTDIDYLRLRGTVNGALIDDQFYTYAYVNQTVTANSILQDYTHAQLQLTAPGDTPSQLYPGDVGTTTPGGGPNDVPGYTKLNAYRVWGNIFRVTDSFDAFDIPVTARLGVWSEGQSTSRRRIYFDETLCAINHCRPFTSDVLYADTSNKSANGHAPNPPIPGVPLGAGYIEHTDWTQYEPFLELEIKPVEELTITPGIKYVYWDHGIDPNSVVKGKPPALYSSLGVPNRFITTRTLPFVTANYKIEPTWSVYFQYAGGIYVPDIGAFEFNTPIASFPKAQTTTNYQFGSVFYADNITADADIYYIDSSNTIQSVTGNGSNGCTSGDSCEINSGPVIYKGVEGEATYTFDAKQFDGWLDGLAVFGNGSLNAARVHVNPTPDAMHIGLGQAYQDKQAPFWTAAGGLIYKHSGWKLSLIDKATGQQYEDSPNGRVDAGGNLIWATNGLSQVIKNPAYSGQSFYKIGAFNILDFTGSYDFGEEFDADWEVGGGVYNILDERDIVSVTINDKKPKGMGIMIPNSVENFAGRPDSSDQYFFAPERSFQINVKARF